MTLEQLEDDVKTKLSTKKQEKTTVLANSWRSAAGH